MSTRLLALWNGKPVPLAEVPVLEIDDLRDAVVTGVRSGARLAALFAAPADAWPGGVAGRHMLVAVLARDAVSTLALGAARVTAAYPAFTTACPQAHWFEREVFEQYGIEPEGHPWLKPIRFQPPLAGGGAAPEIGRAGFFAMGGDEVHEVAVGPVHAGIIEPGHFRFQCHGEDVYHLEISLGYQHRGVERALAGGPDKRTLHYMETLAGDTTTGHTLAHCQAVEALAGCTVPVKGLIIRSIALELERLANHTGDLGALANDVAFLPTAAYCGRLRGDFLNLTARLCGNRFGRGLVVPGGAGFDLTAERAAGIGERLEDVFRDVRGAVELLLDAPSVLARFDDIGRVTAATAREIGLVGPAARGSGVDIDVRRDFPSGIFQFHQMPVSTWSSGDVFGRAAVRWLEIQKSVEFIGFQTAHLAEGPVREPAGPLAAASAVVSLVEGWRGEICHVALTDAAGRFFRYKVVDPSFHNWFGLALALRDQQISDFPLCNKSFNLSYCGHDL
ncbi:MAG: NADH-quinone oxidoreductase subunit C [Planctomycetota bacterium]